MHYNTVDKNTNDTEEDKEKLRQEAIPHRCPHNWLSSSSLAEKG